MKEFTRQSGVFCHPTSLPGPHGIGSIGASSRRFIDTLAEAGQRLWQLCPLGPISGVHDNSPYQAYSAFAIEPLLIDLDQLVADGLLMAKEVESADPFPEETVDYDQVREFTYPLLHTAFERFLDEQPEDVVEAFESFRERVDWLETYAFFRALKDHFGQKAWTEWPEAVANRDPDTLARYREELAVEIEYRVFTQFLAVTQWEELTEYASERGVQIVGDLPIYVAQDSADVWANQELFELREDGTPKDVSGVPADENNPAQKWGPPVYDWASHRESNYEWWIDRLEWQFELADIVRLDHFRGFEKYYAIPADEDGNEGEWRAGPGIEFFERVEEELGELSIIAEDIGFITDAVDQLREDIEAPGMKVLQYADWCSEDHLYLPHTYEEDTVAYPGTHDTNTVRGWYEELGEDQVDCLHYYLGTDGSEIHWDIIECAWHTDSVLAIVPLQDLYGLGGDARFNIPGTDNGNWAWRCRTDLFEEFPTDRLRSVTQSATRIE